MFFITFTFPIHDTTDSRQQTSNNCAEKYTKLKSVKLQFPQCIHTRKFSIIANVNSPERDLDR